MWSPCRGRTHIAIRRAQGAHYALHSSGRAVETLACINLFDLNDTASATVHCVDCVYAEFAVTDEERHQLLSHHVFRWQTGSVERASMQIWRCEAWFDAAVVVGKHRSPTGPLYVATLVRGHLVTVSMTVAAKQRARHARERGADGGVTDWWPDRAL